MPDPTIAGFVGNGAPMLMRRALALAGNTALDRVGDVYGKPRVASTNWIILRFGNPVSQKDVEPGRAGFDIPGSFRDSSYLPGRIDDR